MSYKSRHILFSYCPHTNRLSNPPILSNIFRLIKLTGAIKGVVWSNPTKLWSFILKRYPSSIVCIESDTSSLPRAFQYLNDFPKQSGEYSQSSALQEIVSPVQAR